MLPCTFSVCGCVSGRIICRVIAILDKVPWENTLRGSPKCCFVAVHRHVAELWGDALASRRWPALSEHCTPLYQHQEPLQKSQSHSRMLNYLVTQTLHKSGGIRATQSVEPWNSWKESCEIYLSNFGFKMTSSQSSACVYMHYKTDYTAIQAITSCNWNRHKSKYAYSENRPRRCGWKLIYSGMNTS